MSEPTKQSGELPVDGAEVTDLAAEAAKLAAKAEGSPGSASDTPEDDGIELLQLDPVAILEQQVRDTEARLKTVSAAYRELQTEMAAYRERQERRHQLKVDLAKGDAVKRLFEPLQNLRRTHEALGKAGVAEDLLEGLGLVVRDFMTGFAELGLEEVPGVGSRFNPDYHEALTTVPVALPEQDEIVMEVFSAGYRVRGTLITPARVVIGRHTEPVGEA